jgi:hypothetical protein
MYFSWLWYESLENKITIQVAEIKGNTWESEAINRRSYNTKDQKKNNRTMIYNTQDRKLKIEKHE